MDGEKKAREGWMDERRKGKTDGGREGGRKALPQAEAQRRAAALPGSSRPQPGSGAGPPTC